MYERRDQPPASLTRFWFRVLWHVLVVALVVGVSLVPGILGYRYVFGLSWIDATYQTFMILTNEGPAVDASTSTQKIFVATYSMVATVVFLAAIIMLCTPFVHRMLHHFFSGFRRANEQGTKPVHRSSYDKHDQPRGKLSRFIIRVFWHFMIVQAVLGVSLVVGMLGYQWIFGLSTLDAFYEASMMLTTVGPVTDPETLGQYWFASLYSIYGGIILLVIITTGVSPMLHRLIQTVWSPGDDVAGEDEEPARARTKKGPFQYESRFQMPSGVGRFVLRIAWHVFLAFGVLFLPVLIGLWGYEWALGLSFLDAFYESNMVITTEGTTVDANTARAKIFVSLFAIYGYVFFLAGVGVVLAPVLHRYLQRFWHAVVDTPKKTPEAVTMGVTLPELPDQRPSRRRQFVIRVAWYFVVLYTVLVVTMVPGLLGYQYLFELGGLDSAYNTVMVLTNEGPVVDAETAPQKIFVAVYSMITTVVFLVFIGMVIAPVLQRLLHAFWYIGGDEPAEKAASAKAKA